MNHHGLEPPVVTNDTFTIEQLDAIRAPLAGDSSRYAREQVAETFAAIRHEEQLSAIKPLWQTRAVCRGLTEYFFPAKGERSEAANQRIQIALGMCAVCTVREPCLQYARDNKETYGIWGGVIFGETEAKKWRRLAATT